MEFKFWFKFKYIFIWALGGYFVFHPLAMIIGSFMSGPDELIIRAGHKTVASEVVASFSLRMLPWSLLFAILNGLVGWFHATLKLREKEIRRSFQAQTVLNKLLNIALDIVPLEAVLTRIIDELISLPWFALESKGGSLRSRRWCDGPGYEGTKRFNHLHSKGIPPEKEEEVFLPFFTTKSDGTELGLPIAKKIVEAHGGKLEVREGAVKGATFRVSLPV